MTVGSSSDNESDLLPVLLEDIRSIEPEELILIASREGVSNAERLRQKLEDDPLHCEIIQLESVHDLDEAFRKFNRAVERLVDQGIEASLIAINFTSGTKMMGAGGVLSAVFNRCLELRYLSGTVTKDLRRLVKTHPSAVFAFQDLLRGRNMMLGLRFGLASSVLVGINDSLLTQRDRTVRNGLIRLAEAYAQREAFHPARFLELFETVEFGSPVLDPFGMSEDSRRSVGQLAEEMQRGMPGPAMLMDLYNNGLRRLESGSADDAVSRLYRAMEMLAQWILKRDFDIDTDNVDSRRIPPRDRIAFEALRSIEDGLIKIGLRKSYDLLIILETDVGRHFRRSGPIRQFLARHRDSILAHGLSPIGPDNARRLFEAARDLFLVEIEDFDRQRRLLQFPWLDREVSR